MKRTTHLALAVVLLGAVTSIAALVLLPIFPGACNGCVGSFDLAEVTVGIFLWTGSVAGSALVLGRIGTRRATLLVGVLALAAALILFFLLPVQETGSFPPPYEIGMCGSPAQLAQCFEHVSYSCVVLGSGGVVWAGQYYILTGGCFALPSLPGS